MSLSYHPMLETPANAAPLSVTELTARIKKRLERDFAHIEVSGEVSRLARPASGHLYFTIKDRHAAISAVVWRSTALRLKNLPKEGGEFIFSGHISVYEPRGAYQLIVTRIEESGAGRLAAEFEQRKQLFAERGWFASERKRPLPGLPRHIGIVTSPTAAAFEDVKKVLATRPGWLELTLSPCLVQGSEAPDSIATAMQRLAAMAEPPELILLVRGGGSIEDLWGFNDEAVVKAIVDSPIPVLTGIGHEIDVTLADFAADVRAATPSNAAEMAAPSRDELRRHLPRLPLLAELMQQRLRHAHRQHAALEQAMQHHWQRLQDTRHLHVERAGQQLVEQQRRQLRRATLQLQQQYRRLKQQEPGYQLRQRHQRLNRLQRHLEEASHRAATDGHQRISMARRQLQVALPHQLHSHLRRLRPLSQRITGGGARIIPGRRQQLASLHARLAHASSRHLEQQRAGWRLHLGRLHALGPQQVLSRGYTLTRDASGRIITSIRSLQPGQQVDIHFHDGHADARVEHTRQGDNE